MVVKPLHAFPMGLEQKQTKGTKLEILRFFVFPCGLLSQNESRRCLGPDPNLLRVKL